MYYRCVDGVGSDFIMGAVYDGNLSDDGRYISFASKSEWRPSRFIPWTPRVGDWVKCDGGFEGVIDYIGLGIDIKASNGARAYVNSSNDITPILGRAAC